MTAIAARAEPPVVSFGSNESTWTEAFAGAHPASICQMPAAMVADAFGRTTAMVAMTVDWSGTFMLPFPGARSIRATPSGFTLMAEISNPNAQA
jgi:hypothetical protein